jgi:hypothetical protein
MSIALDLGSWQFRSLRRQGDQLIARAGRAVYAVSQDNPARRKMLSERRVPFAEFGDHLVLFGDAADDWSKTWGMTAIPLCLNGRLQLDDRIVRQVVAALIEALLPLSENRHEYCCLTLPGDMSARERSTTDFIAAVLRNCGYQPQFASQGLAIALAELSNCALTGIGINLGRAQSEFSIVRHGRELARCRIPRGFGMINHAVPSQQRPQDADAGPAEIKLSMPDLLREIIATAAFDMNRRPEWRALAAPVTIAVSGGITALPGFQDLLWSAIQHTSWPFGIRAVRIAADPQWAVCRGCLIQAELEELTAVSNPAA